MVCECTDVHFASFLSGGFTTMAVIDPPEKKWKNAPLWSVLILPSRTSRMAPIQQECLRRIRTLRRQQRPPSKPTIVCRRPFWRIPRPEIIHEF